MSITAWVEPTVGDNAADEPLRERLVGVLDSRAKHVREGVYDPSVHVPHADRPHDHCGTCSPRLPSTAVPNLLTRGLGVTDWTLTGGVSQGTSTGISFSGSSQSARRRILGAAAASREALGSGCPVTLALLARKVGTVTDATLYFGLADGTSFATGARGTLTEADLTTSFERFYFMLASFDPSGHATDVNVRLATDATWSGGGTIQVTLVSLRPGNGLSYWMTGYMERTHRSGSDVQAGPANAYDQRRDFVNATAVTPS